jgi:hypothetical protein
MYGDASPPALKAPPNLNPLTRTPQWAMKSKSPVTGPSLVGRVTPCAPRLQPAGAKFPRPRLPDPLPGRTLIGFPVPTSEFGFSPSPSQSESVRPLSATNPPIQRQRHVASPSLVGRVTPCAPRLQPAGAKFPRHRLPDPLPSKTLIEFPVPTSELGFSPSPSQSESVRPLSATNPLIHESIAKSHPVVVGCTFQAEFRSGP